MQTEYFNNEESISSINEYMRSPALTIQDLNRCYSFLIEFLKEINKDEFYSKGFLQIEGAVDKFLKCAMSNGFNNEKECSNAITASRNLAVNIMKYHNTSDNIFQIISYNIFKKNNQKKILKYTCEEYFLYLFNIINSIYNKIVTDYNSNLNIYNIFDFYTPENIERNDSFDLLRIIAKLINDSNELNKNEKYKFLSRLKVIKDEFDNQIPDLSIIFGVSKEILIILKAISSSKKEESNIVKARDNIEKFTSIIENTCINKNQ